LINWWMMTDHKSPKLWIENHDRRWQEALDGFTIKLVSVSGVDVSSQQLCTNVCAKDNKRPAACQELLNEF